jgi:KDO2-lipid IV(A) lauroyltransferase
VSKSHNSAKFLIKDRLAAGVLRASLHLSSVLPLETARGCGRLLARLLYAMNSKTVRIIRRNIELAYQDRSPLEREALVKAAISEQGALISELGHVWRRSSDYVMSKVSVVGQAHFDEALADKRGVLVLAPHVGNWEVLPHHLVTQGDLLGLFEPPKLPSVGREVLANRQRPGGEYVPTTPKGLVKLIRHFKQGGLTGILPDQVPSHESAGLNVPFMGVDCFTASLCANLLSKSGARALIAGVFRVPGGWEVVYNPVSESIYDKDLKTALQAMNKDIEKLIFGRDQQYQWSYKRFRTVPRSLADHYAGVKNRGGKK